MTAESSWWRSKPRPEKVILDPTALDDRFVNVTGDTMTGDLTMDANILFDVGTRTLAGIQNQNLLDKTASETLTGIFIFTASGIFIDRNDATDVGAAIRFRNSAVPTDFYDLLYDGNKVVVRGSGTISPGFEIEGDLSFDTTARLVAGIQNQNLVDKTAVETITGLWTHNNNLAFDLGTRTIAGIQNQNLLDKTANETITGIYTVTQPGAQLILIADSSNPLEIRSGSSNKGKIYHESNDLFINMGESVGKNIRLVTADVILDSTREITKARVPTADADVANKKYVDDNAGADTNPVKEYYWSAADTSALEAGDNFAPLTKDAGTNVDLLTASFDDSTDEARQVQFKVPSDVESGSTITFRLIWYSQTATTGNVIWDARHTSGDSEGESWDSALTTEAAAADAVQGTVDQVTVTTWTETLANLGWAANDLVTLLIFRDANNASDTMTGDAEMIGFGVEIPRA